MALTPELAGLTGMVRPERPHGETASPKWLAGSPDRTDPTRDQTPYPSRTRSVDRRQSVPRGHCDDSPSPTAVGGVGHRSPQADAKPLPASGAAEQSRPLMLSADDPDGDELLRSPDRGIGSGQSTEAGGTSSAGPPLLITVEVASELLRLGRTRTYDFIRCGSI